MGAKIESKKSDEKIDAVYILFQDIHFCIELHKTQNSDYDLIIIRPYNSNKKPVEKSVSRLKQPLRSLANENRMLSSESTRDLFVQIRGRKEQTFFSEKIINGFALATYLVEIIYNSKFN